MKRPVIVTVAALLVVLVAGGWLYLASPGRQAVAPVSEQDTDAPPGNGPGRTTSSFQELAKRGDALEGQPASWRGTTPDGALREDDEGNLIISEGLRRRFDYFLSALGEEDLQTIRARVAAHLKASLGERAARRAWELFEHYLGYRSALAELPEYQNDAGAVGESLAQRRALRESWFDAETREAFFGFEDRYAEFAVARRRVLESELDESEKQARLEALERDLPSDMQEMVRASRRPGRVSERVAALREEGAGAAEIYQYREQRLGSEAAERLADLDRERDRWDRRYREYRERRADILDSGLADSDREQAIERLREEMFDASERRRAAAQDRIRTAR